MKIKNRILRFFLVTLLFAVIYFLADRFAITDEKRTASHRVGIEKLNRIEQQLVGKWWTSYSGFKEEMECVTNSQSLDIRYFLLMEGTGKKVQITKDKIEQTGQ